MSMRELYREILQSVEQGSPILLETAVSGKQGDIQHNMTKRIVEIPRESGTASELCMKVEKRELENQIIFREPVFPAERLIILGAGHVALSVCEFAARIGFSVIVCDDRPEFANRRRFPLAAEVLCDSFRNILQRLQVTSYDYVVILTRGHRYDAECLRVLLTGAFPYYLGLIGSRRRVRGLFDMLCEEGYSRELLNRICTPIGLDIGAVTPEEIGISILAELVAYKRKPESYGHHVNLYTNSDLEQDMIRYLAELSEPQAIVTIIETKGSTPRSAGAKMAVNIAGQTTGSIGGGCAESAVIHEAVRLIGTGRYQIMEIDMTGDIAEADGMVCGGVMQVLIEDAMIF